MSAAHRSHTDLRAGTWIDRWLPGWLRPAARLARWDRPIGTWLLLLPGWLALLLAEATAPAHQGWGVATPWALIALFAVGAVAMRGAGCTINDLWDRNLDAAVARTAGRPLPAGEIGVAGALVFLAAQLLVGAAVLVTLHPVAIVLALASMILVVLYPLAKRVTYWPQAVLGLTFNFSALVGWAAVTGTLGWPALLLYLGGLCWTLGYDTIYAHQDKSDDAVIGVKSSALKLGVWTRPFVAAVYAGAILLWGAAGVLAGVAWPYYAGLAAGAAHFGWQVGWVAIDDPADCLRRFKSNRDAGLMVVLGLLVATMAG